MLTTLSIFDTIAVSLEGSLRVPFFRFWRGELIMSKKPYHDHVSFEEIIEDGWSRGFDPEQTVDEAAAMGYTVTLFEVQERWKEHQKVMDDYYKERK